jgi:hypothetical protein
VAANTVVFVLAVLMGWVMSALVIASASLRYWQQYAAIQVGVGVAYLLAGALCTLWTSQRAAILIPAGLVALLPVMLSYTESVVLDNRRINWPDLARDLSIGAAMWHSWASLALICAMASVGCGSTHWLHERRSG